MPSRTATGRDPLHGTRSFSTQVPLFQTEIENIRTFYAASSATATVTPYTVPSKNKATIHRWSICYTGADVGAETISLFLVTPAAAAIKLGQSVLAVNETLWVIADGDLPMHLESSYGIRYSVTGGATIDCIVSGIEYRLPS